MAKVVGNTYLTLKDKMAQMENGKVTSSVIELLSRNCPIVEDAVVRECNDGSSHKTTVRNGLPEAEFRKFYQGVTCSKGQYTQVTDATGMLEVYSEVDKALADLEGDLEQFRLNEAQAFLESMTQTFEENIFYANKDKNPCGFDGLANRYNKISDDKTSIGNYVIDGGGTGNTNTSIWFITWGDLHTHLLYPKGSKAGIQHTDKGQQTHSGDDGSMYEVYRDHFKWDVGLTVRDFRSTARIANIDVTQLDGANAANLINLMVKAYHKIKKYAKTGNTIIYCNTAIETALHTQISNKNNIHLTVKEYMGAPAAHFLDIPIRNCDTIVENEQKVIKAQV